VFACERSGLCWLGLTGRQTPPPAATLMISRAHSERYLFAFILAESFCLSMLGAFVGIGGAWLFWSTINLQKLTQGFLVYFEVTPRIMATGGIVAALLGIVAAIGPSVSVARMSVVSGLKTLD